MSRKRPLKLVRVGEDDEASIKEAMESVLKAQHEEEVIPPLPAATVVAPRVAPQLTLPPLLDEEAVDEVVAGAPSSVVATRDVDGKISVAGGGVQRGRKRAALELVSVGGVAAPLSRK